MIEQNDLIAAHIAAVMGAELGNSVLDPVFWQVEYFAWREPVLADHGGLVALVLRERADHPGARSVRPRMVIENGLPVGEGPRMKIWAD